MCAQLVHSNPSVSPVPAADENFTASSLYDLGLRYSTGNGVELDLIEAHKWLSLAALQGDKRALVDRLELAQEMSQDEIAEAQRQARQWLSLH